MDNGTVLVYYKKKPKDVTDKPKGLIQLQDVDYCKV